MAFSENVRNKRISLRLTPQELADKSGVSRQSIMKYEAGMAIPNAVVALNIARVLGTTVEQLVEGETA